MTGRRHAHWRDSNGTEQGGLVSNRAWDYVPSFEDALIDEMDGLSDEMVSALDSLTPVEREAFDLKADGYTHLTPAQRKALERARRKLIPVTKRPPGAY